MAKLTQGNKVVLSLISVAVFVAIYTFLITYDLKNNGKLINGEFGGLMSGSKGSMLMCFSYEYENKKCNSTTQICIENRFVSKFIGKSFPVLVSKFTKNSTILISPRHFERYNLPFPDSLMWVIPFLNSAHTPSFKTIRKKDTLW